jgi:hypothetical protein
MLIFHTDTKISYFSKSWVHLKPLFMVPITHIHLNIKTSQIMYYIYQFQQLQ